MRYKHIISILTMSVATVIPTAAQTFSGGGNGTADSPYIIKTAADLDMLNTMTDNGQTLGRYYRLGNDITEAYTGIIGEAGVFYGTFDGDGHCIRVDIERPGESYLGLFGTVRGTIKNLAIEGMVIGSRAVGGIVGNPTNGARLENLVNYADVEGRSTGVMASIGGVAGYIVSQTTAGNPSYSKDSVYITNCANYGTIIGSDCVGGVVGYSGQQRGNVHTRLVNYGLICSSGERAAGVIGNPLYYDLVEGLVNLGPIFSETVSGVMGNANPQHQAELFYDRQYAFTVYEYPSQSRLTSEIIGTGLRNNETGSEMSDEYWLFEEDMLPRLKMGGQEYSDRAILYATPILLEADNTLADISKPFRAVTRNGVTWRSMNGYVSFDAEGNATLWQKGSDILIAQKGDYTRELEVQITDVATRIETPTISNGMRKVYDLKGQRMRSTTSLPKGVYIVRENGRTQKISIR